MKKTRHLLLMLLLAASAGNLFAQSNIPQLVSFSAVVRDQNNNPLVNTPVSLRLTFRQGGQNGPLMYCALQQDVTNANGFISILLNRNVLGTGCNGAPSTAFEDIPWRDGGFWMEVEYQTIPSNPFVNLGQLELASSFYAFSAGTAETLAGFTMAGAQNGDILVYNLNTQRWEPAPAPVPFTGDYNDLINAPTLLSQFTNDVGYITDPNDADNDPTNELQNWSNLPGIPAGFADGIDDVDDADNDPTNELQNWNNLPGIPAGFADGIDDVDDADIDPTNELQNMSVSLTGDTLHLSNGNWVIIPGISALNN